MKAIHQGILFIIAAPSGAGKTSLVSALQARDGRMQVSISHTTRPKRPAETDGVNYHFIDEDKFNELINKDYFLEHAHVFKHYYGTSKAWVKDVLASGKDVILEIDWQGAQQIRDLMPGCVSIFIMPPSTDTLAERLEGRGQDSQSTIEHRLAKAKMEMSHCKEFDFIVVNDDFDDALEDLQAIIRASHLRHQPQEVFHAELLEQLLS